MADKKQAHGEQGHDHGHAHADPIVAYIGVFLTLMVLTWVTVQVAKYSFTDWDSGHVTVAMIVACIKATLVIAIFMHGWQASGLIKIVIVTSILTLMILFAFTYWDYSSRGKSSVGREAMELQMK